MQYGLKWSSYERNKNIICSYYGGDSWYDFINSYSKITTRYVRLNNKYNKKIYYFIEVYCASPLND